MVLCLHQGNIYTKRKLRVWRDQKCIPLVGALTPLTCLVRQSTQARGRKYRAQNGKLRKLGRTYLHGTVFAPRKYLHQKEAKGMDRPEMYSASRCNNPHLPLRAVKIHCLEGGSIGPRTESCVSWDRPISMVPCLQQGNIYKRKLRVWRDQKCIPLAGAITPLNCVGHESTPSRGRQHRAQNGKVRKLSRTYLHGTVFAPRKYLYQKEAKGMERPEMYSVSRCNNSTYLCGPS